jgi:hypothetical protein
MESLIDWNVPKYKILGFNKKSLISIQQEDSKIGGETGGPGGQANRQIRFVPEPTARSAVPCVSPGRGY